MEVRVKFILFIFLILNISITGIYAEETRQVDKHEHGVGELNIAIDSNMIALEFMLPGADIVGFEYKAKSDEDLAKIESALMKFKKYENLFILPKNAYCTLLDVDSHLSG